MNSLPMLIPALVVMSAPSEHGGHRAGRVAGVRERGRVVGEHRAVRPDPHPAVDRRPEAPEVAELRVDDGGRLEDRLPFAEERLLVAGRQDDRRDDRQAQPVAGGVHQPDLGMDLQVADPLRGEGPVLRPHRGLIAGRALPRHDGQRQDHPELEAQVRQVGEADRRLQRRHHQGVHGELGRLGAGHAIQHQRLARVGRDEAEGEIPLPENSRGVDGDEPFRVHRRAEDLEIDRRNLQLGLGGRDEAGHGRCDDGRLDQTPAWASEHEHLR